jgi:protein-S-isoprenylcysteine O-methyltransferase Ste14
VALAGLIAFGAVAFGWRIWLQYRRTGDTGVRGSSRTAGGVVAGLGLLPGALAIVAATILDLTNTLDPLEPWVHTPVQAFGAVCFAMGFALAVRAQLDMGASWRIGVDSSETTRLITGGVFRHVRNPIFTGTALAFCGVALLVPNVVALVGVALFVVGLQLHVRLVEEPYLARVHGDAYHSTRAPPGAVPARRAR